MLLETPLHPRKVTVWCGFLAGGVIGPYFFVDENDRHVTVNGERYRAMLEDYLWPELDELDIHDMWFQQDSITSHTARVIIDLLNGKFGERVISRNGPVEWPPRSYQYLKHFCVLFIDKIVMSLLENPLQKVK